MENESGKREWVKTAAIVFLSILLVLTFFSNTIMNRTLPEVSTEAVASGTITAKVRGSGTVSAIGSNEVKATGTRSIAAVKIKAGQEVNEGDVLFVMGSAADEEVETAKDTYDDLYYALLRTQASYPVNSSSDSYMAAYDNYQVACANEKVAYEELQASLQYGKRQEYLDAVNQLNVENAILIVCNEEVAKNQASLEKDMNDKLVIYNDLFAAWQSATDPYEEARLHSESDNAYLDYNLAVTKYNNSFLYSDELVQKATEQEGKVNALEAYIASFPTETTGASAKYDAAVNARIAAESALAAAEAAYYSSQASYGQSAAMHNVDVQQAQHNLDRQEEKIASLTGEGEDANVYAKVSGIVENVNFSAGDTVVKDDILCTIEVPDQGYTVTISVTKEQAGRLQIGDTADISNYYWGSSITATVSSIKTDPKNPQSNKLVTFDITGDVTTGQELKIAIGQKSASYDCIVPNSAVMSDSNGKFVLTVESKQSPLGNRYFARRVDVDVLGSDDINSAVNGNIGNGDFVITTSSIHINNGDQVRLSDAG